MQVDGCQLRYERLSNLCEAYERAPESWLTNDEELAELARLNDDFRRRSWLAGRWQAKRLIRELLPAKSISIQTRNEFGQADRPRVTIDGVEWDRSLSISHSDRGVLIALADSNETEVGVDLTEEKLATPGFLTTWFTPAERATLSVLSNNEVTLFWAVKEAVYKACQQGESFKPRKFEVSRCQTGGYECHYEETGETVRQITVDHVDRHFAVIAVVSKQQTPLAV